MKTKVLLEVELTAECDAEGGYEEETLAGFAVEDLEIDVLRKGWETRPIDDEHPMRVTGRISKVINRDAELLDDMDVNELRGIVCEFFSVGVWGSLFDMVSEGERKRVMKEYILHWVSVKSLKEKGFIN